MSVGSSVWRNFVVFQAPRIFEVSRRFLENVRTFAQDRPPRVGCWRQKNLWMCNFSVGGVGLRLHDADGIIFNNELSVKFNLSPLIISVEKSPLCVKPSCTNI
jgi:hypothetical protein